MTAVDEPMTTDRAELNEYIGRHMRYHREKRGLPQATVAAEMGIAAATLSTWESGRVAPSVAGLVSFAAAVGIAPGLLLPKDGA